MHGYLRVGLLLAASIATTLTLVRPARSQAACVDCHASQRAPVLRAPATVAQDTHRRADVPCTGCHGGENVPRMTAHAPGTAFSGRPAPATCLACHAEGPATLARAAEGYLKSAHARSLAEGHAGATCADCHGAHGELSVHAPSSPAHWTRIAETCGRCHDDAASVGEDAARRAPLRRWSRSIHGRVVLASARRREKQPVDERDRRHAPTCSDCHDPHGATQGDDAVEACVRCHQAVREAFDAGPHAEAYRARGFLDCVACHGSHEILSADASLVTAGLESACRRCHAPGQPVYDEIRRLGAALLRADAARRTLARTARGAGEAEALATAVHRLDLDAVERAASALEDAARQAPAPEAERNASVFGASVSWAAGVGVALTATVVAIVFAFLFIARRRRARSDRDRTEREG